MTDASGAAQARYDYDPYGKRTKLTGTLDVDFGYTGHYHHAVSGLNLALYRAYDPAVGRWLSRDPLGEIDGPNLYVYVENDPINSKDLLGLIENYWQDPGYLKKDCDYHFRTLCQEKCRFAGGLKIKWCYQYRLPFTPWTRVSGWLCACEACGN